MRATREARNALQLRDWEIELYSGEIPPKGFEPYYLNSGATLSERDVLRARIWINMLQCKEQNHDPLAVVLHEISHIWLEAMEDDELMCNILTLLMMD